MGNTEETNESGEHQEPLPEQANSQNGNPAGEQGSGARGMNSESAASERVLQMTQSQLDELMGGRAQRAKAAAIKDLLAEVGVENTDQLKTVFAAHKAAQDAQKTDLQKAQEQIEALRRETNEKRAAYEQQLIRNAIMLKASTFEVPPDRLDALLRLMDKSSLTVKEETVEGVDAALKATIAANPFLLYTDKGASKGTPLTSRQAKTQRQSQPPVSEEPGWKRRNPLAKL